MTKCEFYIFLREAKRNVAFPISRCFPVEICICIT